MRPSYSTIRQASRSKTWVWLLSVLLLAQTFIPLQSHTQWKTNAAGKTVLVCTLQGTKQVVLDQFGEKVQQIESVHAADSERSAAVEFSQLMTEATDQVFDPLIHLYLLPASKQQQLAILSSPFIAKGNRSIRAPPLA